MIFHVPYPLNPSATSASGIRPVRMRKAFESLGYRVSEVSGPAAQRRRQIAALRKEIREGATFDLLYSEASTMPTAITETHHLPTHPFLDLAFLRFARRRGIPVGVFYRDIYWQFEEYSRSVNPVVALGTRFLYRSDLRAYRSAVDRIFLPSMKMAEYLPSENAAQSTALPPGAEIVDGTPPAGDLTVLFVGGLGAYYRMQEAVLGVELSEGAKLTVCTRADQWQASAEDYEAVLGNATTVVHRSGAELEELYANSHIGSLFMEPIEYREFAAPMKLYEYLGHGKPVIATEGTLAGEFVRENGIGWVLPYRAEALTELLNRLQRHPDELAAVSARVREVRLDHTWEARARQAAQALTGRSVGSVASN